MQFGMFGGATAKRGGPDVDSSAGYRDFIEQNIEAEALGYHSTFMVEHHFTGAGQISASLNLLTWLGAKTTTLRLGTAVLVLPWHNPVLIAEQVATIDLLSGGRLDLGVGKGYRVPEFEGFCIPVENAEERFNEVLEVMLKALSSEQRFSHHGKYWNFENIVVEPPPAQRPHPPIWMGAGSPASIKQVAQRGGNLLLDQFASFETIGERIAIYREECERLGRKFDPMNVAVARAVYVAKDAADKEAAMDRRMASQANLVKASGSAAGKASIVSFSDQRDISEASVLFGTPDEIHRKVERLRSFGVEYVLLNAGVAERPREILRRFAREIMPAHSGQQQRVRLVG